MICYEDANGNFSIKYQMLWAGRNNFLPVTVTSIIIAAKKVE